MKPFIYNFLDRSVENFDDVTKLIEYSSKLNLTVIKGTDHPAIALHEFGTQTMNKGQGTDSDIDQSESLSIAQLQRNFGTNTFTRADRETSDSDQQVEIGRTIQALTDTVTLTLTGREASDSDNQRLFQMLSTRTMTESKEATDSDS